MTTRLSQQELQNLRHLIYSHETAADKFQSYAEQCHDRQLKQWFLKAAQDAVETKNKLVSFLK